VAQAPPQPVRAGHCRGDGPVRHNPSQHVILCHLLPSHLPVAMPLSQLATPRRHCHDVIRSSHNNTVMSPLLTSLRLHVAARIGWTVGWVVSDALSHNRQSKSPSPRPQSSSPSAQAQQRLQIHRINACTPPYQRTHPTASTCTAAPASLSTQNTAKMIFLGSNRCR
jgi:hypothetical protein